MSLLGRPPKTPDERALEAAWEALERWDLPKARENLAQTAGHPLVQAMLARREGRSRAALTLFAQAVTQADGETQDIARIELAHQHQLLGQVAQAAEALRVEVNGPQRARWRLAVAQLDLQQGRPNSAREHLMAACSEAIDPLRLGSAWLTLATLECSQGNFEEVDRCLDQARTVGLDPQRRASALLTQAQVALQRGRPDEADVKAAEALFREVGDDRGRAAALRLLAELSLDQPGQALDHLRQAILLLEALEDRRGRAATLHEQAILCHQQGLSDRARVLGDEVLTEARALGDLQAQAAALHLLAQVEITSGRRDQAHAMLSASLGVLEALGNRQDRAASLIMLGQLEAHMGRTDQGKARLEEAIEELERLGSGMLASAQQALRQLTGPDAAFRDLLGRTVDALGRGQLELAHQAAAQALMLARAHRRPDVEAIAHTQMAQVLMAQDRPRLAAPHLRTADQLFGQQGKGEQQAMVRALLAQLR